MSLRGVLYPNAIGEPGSYEFLYKQSGTECEGGGKTLLAGIATGNQGEEVFETLSGLEAGKQYTVCLAVSNGTEATLSSPVTVKTSVPPETPTEEKASGVTANEAKLEGTLNPGQEGEPGSYEFLHRESATECEGEGEKATFAESNGELKEHAEATVGELLPNTTYAFCLLTRNQTGETALGVSVTFTTALEKPQIVAQSAEAIELTSTSVELTAKVNPEGSATSYRIEYGTSTEYGVTLPAPPAPEQSIGEGHQPVSVQQTISTLQPNVTYHWRLVATNSAGDTTGTDHTFVNDTTGEKLPDNRAYEMVTPPNKNTAALGRIRSSTPIGISADGSRVIAGALQCFADAESCTGSGKSGIGEPFLFSRAGGAWLTSALAPSSALLPSNSQVTVSAETGEALFEAPTPSAETSSFYVRTPNGHFEDIGPLSAQPPSTLSRGVVATADFSHVIFQPGFQQPEPWPSLVPGPHRETLYEYSGSGNSVPRLVGVSGGPGSTSLISACSTALGGANAREPGVLSADGAVVFFTALACEEGTGENVGPGHAVPVNELFARIDAAQTVPISQPSAFSPAAPYPGCTEEPCVRDVNESGNWREATFQAASADGKKVLFETEQRLLDDAEEGPNLYEYDFDRPEAHLTDLSAGDQSGHGARFLGLVAASPDGSHVYFVAAGVLDKSANATGQAAQDGADNLYVYSQEGAGGQVSFITSLDESDLMLWGAEGPQDAIANVTPDGRVLVFPSYARITPDTGESGQQVFRYDAIARQITRVSSGRHGFNDDGNAGVGDATIVPTIEQIGFRPAGPHRADPTMSDDGSYVFFQSPKALTPGALNDVLIGVETTETHHDIYAQNIYEWHEGEVHLISDGHDTTLSVQASDVELLGSDGSGSNVFFTTSDPLVSEDTDTQVDIYDARICSATSPCIPGAPRLTVGCGGEDCRGTPSAGTPAPAIASEEFSGPGNATSSPATVSRRRATSKLAHALALCRRAHHHSRRKRARCEATARRRYGHISKVTHTRERRRDAR